jgi:integrase
MASVWITRRPRKNGGHTFRVMFRTGGRESMPRYGGAFGTMREAKLRRDWIAGELASLRVPDLRLGAEPAQTTLAAAARRWQESRVDVSAGTAQTYAVCLNRLLPRLGDLPLSKLEPQTVAALVAELHGAGLKRSSIRKTISVLAMILDHERIEPNPARDRLTVKLPREEKRILQPPDAATVEAAVRLLPSRYRLPALVLDACGMRIGELEALRWEDVDEPRGRWRIATSKTGRPRWVTPPETIFAAVAALVAREDRVPDRPVFQGFGGDRFRTALQRACSAAGVPSFSPHDLRHRRVSLLHLAGVPWARIGEAVGHDDLVTTARTYTHTLVSEDELDYQSLLA